MHVLDREKDLEVCLSLHAWVRSRARTSQGLIAGTPVIPSLARLHIDKKLDFYITKLLRSSTRLPHSSPSALLLVLLCKTVAMAKRSAPVQDPGGAKRQKLDGVHPTRRQQLEKPPQGLENVGERLQKAEEIYSSQQLQSLLAFQQDVSELRRGSQPSPSKL